MSETLQAIVSALLLAAGAAVFALGLWGARRAPTTLSRLHAARAGLESGAPLMLFGLALSAPTLSAALAPALAGVLVPVVSRYVANAFAGAAYAAAKSARDNLE